MASDQYVLTILNSSKKIDSKHVAGSKHKLCTLLQTGKEGGVKNSKYNNVGNKIFKNRKKMKAK